MAQERLLSACEAGHLDEARAAVADGASPSAGDRWQTSPLHLACRGGHLGVARWLASLGVRCDLRVRFGLTPIHTACEENRLEAVQWLVHRPEVNIESRDDLGYTPLHAAVHCGALRTAQWLSEHGAEVWTRSHYSKGILHTACEEGHLRTAQWVASLPGADIRKEVEGETPLLAACFKGQMEIARWLCGLPGVGGKEDSARGWTPFSAACLSGSVELARFLYDSGCGVWDKWSPLHVACGNGDFPMMSWLLCLPEIDVKARDSLGQTAFQEACEMGDEEIARWLRARGADVGAENPQGWPWLARLQARRSVLSVWGGVGGGAEAACVRAMCRSVLAEVLLLTA